MFKHRDTDDLNNRIGWFAGPRFTFIGLENASSPGNEVWTGTNSAGFSIMNTASYNIKNDNVPDDQMDQEGALMFKALGLCETTADFEELLNTLPRPMGVEANFGVIDAKGGAAYYEVNNNSWVKYDVNDPSVAPNGYRVVTNFSFSGRKEDYKGYERYLTATAVMKEIQSTIGISSVNHSTLFNNLSRNYRHEYLGVDYTKNYDSMIASGFFNGRTVDQDFIPRRITSAQIVIEGVRPGEDPKHTVMWTILGYPSTSVAMPLIVGDKDLLPSYVKKSDTNPNAGKTIIEAAQLGFDTDIDCYAVSAFNRNNADYYIQVSYEYNAYLLEQDSVDIVDKLVEDVKNGSGPDILLNVNENACFLSEDVALNLNDYIDGKQGVNREDYFDCAFTPLQIEGAQYVMPLEIQMFGMLVDSACLNSDENGFTYDEYIRFVDEVCNGRDPVALDRLEYFLSCERAMSDRFLSSGNAISDIIDKTLIINSY